MLPKGAQKLADKGERGDPGWNPPRKKKEYCKHQTYCGERVHAGKGKPQTLRRPTRSAADCVRPGGEFWHAFWFPFGSLLAPFGLLLVHFGSLFSADVAEACRFLASHLLASSGRWGAAVSLCVYNDILKVLASKIEQLGPHGRISIHFGIILEAF